MNIYKSVSLLIFFVFLVSKVRSQEITMFPGFWSAEYYQDDEKISKKQLEVLLAKNEEVQAYWKKSKTQEIVAGIAVIGEIGFLVWAYSEILNDNPYLSNRDKAKNAIGPLLGGIGATTIAAIFHTASNKSKRRAILTYNKQFDKKNVYRLAPVGNENGLGLAIRF